VFALGSSAWDRDAQRYLCPGDVEEGDDEDPIPEEDVRLDEVLVEPGDQLHYVYDYGDDWEHLVQLEVVVERPTGVSARCTDGRREGPPEDCGGIEAFQQLVAAGRIDEDVPDLDEINALLSLLASTDAGDHD
jgi:hypothetical protein